MLGCQENELIQEQLVRSPGTVCELRVARVDRGSQHDEDFEELLVMFRRHRGYGEVAADRENCSAPGVTVRRQLDTF